MISLTNIVGVFAVAAAVAYARRVSHLRGTTSAVPGWRQACMFAGLLLLTGSIISLASIADELFAAHMLEHLMLGDIAPLLIVLGLTGPVLAPILRVGVLRVLRVLTHPVVAFGLWAVNLYAWHLPVLHEEAVRDDLVHAVQHGCFLFFGLNMWMALLGPLPKPAWFGNAAQLGYIIAVRLTGAVLGNIFVFGSVGYDVYAPGEAAHNISPAADQATAGGIMMVEGSLLTICLFAWLFLKTARQSDEKQELVELAQARGVELTDARAARAVAAGRGRELRERIEASAGPLAE